MKTTVASIRKVPLMHDEIVQFAKYRNPISHPVAIFRKQAVLSVGGYPEFRKSQDYALWALMLKSGYHFANINEVLLKMRCGDALLGRRGIKYFKSEFEILKYQKAIMFIDNFEFIRNLIIRFGIRILPNSMKKILYTLAR
jgi:hypothetical protein